jgi:hypothetical protein
MAGNTLNLGLPYPSGGDANDVPYWLQALAEAIDGALGGSWTSYTPTFGNFVVGLSTVVARYKRIGKTVHYSGLVTLGTGFSMNSSPLAIGLPFGLGGSFNNILNSLGTSMLNDNGSGTYMAMLTPSTGTALMVRAYNGGAVTISSPFAWAVGDSFSWNVTYETSA